VGAGTNDTRTTIARHEELAEVPGVVASLAVVVYNVPYRTGRGLGATSLLELAAHPHVAGVKQAVGGIDADTLRVLAEAPPTCAILGGDDAYLLPIVLMGGAGAIAAAHVRTSDFVRMIDDGLAGLESCGHQGRPARRGRLPTPDVRMALTNASKPAVDDALAAITATTPVPVRP
jgi:4-hydroxy-tetrahydrodipicolinate synthase